MRNSVKTLRAASLLAALSATTFSSLAAQNATASDVEALREQIRLLDQKLRVLERNSELAAETAAADAKKLPKITASEGRFEITSSDGANSLRLRGLVQADARFFFDDSNSASGQDQFLLRRARLIFEGKFAERFSYVVQPEFAGSTVSILEANLNLAVNPTFNIQAGRFKTPVGLEQLQSDPVAFFNERSIANNLAPNRDVGVQLHGSVLEKRLGYQLAVTNGVIDGGNSPTDSSNIEGDFTYSARLFATPFANDKDSALKGLGFGLAGATGNYGGSPASPLVNAYRTDGQQTFFRYRAAATGVVPDALNTVVADGNSFVISPQAYFYSGPFGLLAEYFSSSSELTVGGATEKLNNKAFNISVGYDQEEALELADEVVVMNNARIEQVGTPQEVYDRPATPFVIEFLGNVNRFAALGHPLPGAGNDALYVRPHDVDIQRDYRGEHGIRVRVQHVFSAGNFGRVALERIDNRETIDAEVARFRLAELNLKPGDEAWVVFRHIRLFPAGNFAERDVSTDDTTPATFDAGRGI